MLAEDLSCRSDPEERYPLLIVRQGRVCSKAWEQAKRAGSFDSLTAHQWNEAEEVTCANARTVLMHFSGAVPSRSDYPARQTCLAFVPHSLIYLKLAAYLF